MIYIPDNLENMRHSAIIQWSVLVIIQIFLWALLVASGFVFLMGSLGFDGFASMTVGQVIFDVSVGIVIAIVFRTIKVFIEKKNTKENTEENAKETEEFKSEIVEITFLDEKANLILNVPKATNEEDLKIILKEIFLNFSITATLPEAPEPPES